MNVMEFIVKEGLVLIPVLFVLGEIITRTETVHNKFIPLLLLVVSLLLTPLVLGGYTANSIVQAVLVAGATVFGHELIKQSKRT